MVFFCCRKLNPNDFAELPAIYQPVSLEKNDQMTLTLSYPVSLETHPFSSMLYNSHFCYTATYWLIMKFTRWSFS